MRPLAALRAALRSIWADAAVAAALLALGQYEVWSTVRYDGGAVYPGPRLVNALVVVPLLTAPLVLRRRAPLVAFGAVMGTLAAASLVLGGGEASSEFLAAMVAVYSAAANTDRHRLVAGATVAAGALHVVRDPHVHGVGDVAFGAGFLAVPFLFGVVVRGRGRRISSLEVETARLEARRVEDALAAVAAERARVARELHDVVAHAVSVVVVQSQAGQRLVGRDDDGARRSLESIEETARTALDEMRRLLGMLRDADAASLEPQPGLDRLGELVAQVRAAGLAVALEVEGEPVRLPPGLDLSAYRVVQEGLTNALKHAGDARATVRVRYGPGAIELEVADDGGGRRNGRQPAPATADDGGHGLIGMRERVALYGGTLDGGRQPDGGWLLHARLPLAP